LQEAAVIASNKLCLLLIQGGKNDQARALLINRGCEFRLSDEVGMKGLILTLGSRIKDRGSA